MPDERGVALSPGETARCDQDEEAARRVARAVIAFRRELLGAGLHECQVDEMADRYLMSLLISIEEGEDE